MITASLLLFTGCYDVEGIAVGMPKHSDDIAGGTDDTETADTPTDDIDTADTTTETREIEEVIITFDEEGWISGAENSLHVQGGWYPTVGMESSIDSPTYNGNSVCLAGDVAPPDGNDFQNYFGAKIGFDVCATGNRAKTSDFTSYTLSDCPYNEFLADQIAGVRVNISGTQLPTTELRLQFNEAEDRPDGTYVVLNGEGEHTALLSDARIYYDTAANPINVEAINAINFYISSTDGPSDFNFCISDIRILVYL